MNIISIGSATGAGLSDGNGITYNEYFNSGCGTSIGGYGDGYGDGDGTGDGNGNGGGNGYGNGGGTGGGYGIGDTFRIVEGAGNCY